MRSKEKIEELEAAIRKLTERVEQLEAKTAKAPAKTGKK